MKTGVYSGVCWDGPLQGEMFSVAIDLIEGDPVVILSRKDNCIAAPCYEYRLKSTPSIPAMKWLYTGRNGVDGVLFETKGETMFTVTISVHGPKGATPIHTEDGHVSKLEWANFAANEIARQKAEKTGLEVHTETHEDGRVKHVLKDNHTFGVTGLAQMITIMTIEVTVLKN